MCPSNILLTKSNYFQSHIMRSNWLAHIAELLIHILLYNYDAYIIMTLIVLEDYRILRLREYSTYGRLITIIPRIYKNEMIPLGKLMLKAECANFIPMESVLTSV